MFTFDTKDKDTYSFVEAVEKDNEEYRNELVRAAQFLKNVYGLDITVEDLDALLSWSKNNVHY
jgi:hypothetical protein